MQDYPGKAFSSFQLAGLKLRNRFVKTATYEGMMKNGRPSGEFYRFHSEMAKNQVALTTVAYGSVNRDGLTHENQMILGKGSEPYLVRLGEEVHKHGGAVSVQLTHCGFFTKSIKYDSRRPLSSSATLNKYGLLRGRGLSRPMTLQELKTTASDFGTAASVVKSAGLDAVEIHMGHGYLLSQFLSPLINKRKDKYGGSLVNRIRFPLEVFREIRQAVGDKFPVLCKLNLSDGFRGGLTLENSAEICKILEQEGVDALVLSGGYTSKTPFYLMRGDVPLKQMVKAEDSLVQKAVMAGFGRMIIRKYKFEENFFLPQALKIRENVTMPLCYVGGVISAAGIARIMDSGFDMIAIGRALIHDPGFLNRVKENAAHISECNQCNECVAAMEHSGVRCVLRDS